MCVKVFLVLALILCNFQNINCIQFLVTGIQWSNIFFAGEIQYNITGSNGFIFIFSILGTLLHFSLTVYINAVYPGKYGIRQNPLYFLKVKCVRKTKNVFEIPIIECINDDFF